MRSNSDEKLHDAMDKDKHYPDKISYLFENSIEKNRIEVSKVFELLTFNFQSVSFSFIIIPVIIIDEHLAQTQRVDRGEGKLHDFRFRQSNIP